MAVAEQANSDAQAKAAEVAGKARLAAEKKKQAEERRSSPNRSGWPPRRRKEAAGRGSPGQVTAALPTDAGQPDAGEIPWHAGSCPRLLQSELRRVGCKTGEIDSEWNASSRRALSAFNDNAKTKFDVKLASLDALDAVAPGTGRVCPLACDRGNRASGDQMREGHLRQRLRGGGDGSCQKRPKVVQQRERRGPRRGRGRCFAFNGKQVCEWTAAPRRRACSRNSVIRFLNNFPSFT